MMILPALTMMLAMQDSTKEWSNPSTDIKLKYPSSWSVKKEQYSDEIRFKIGDREVRVSLLGIEMNFPPSHWQDVTREINTNNDRTVLRQWEEEFLGVPILMTRVRDISGNEPEIIISGLLMSARPQKFLYRLYASEGIIGEAEAQWNQVLLSADTVSGKLPGEQLPTTTDPTNTNVTVNTNNPGKVQVLQPKNNGPKEIKRGPVRLPLDVERGTFIYLPEGWTMKDGVLSNGTIQIELSHGIGDERQSRSAWLKMCGAGLDKLSKVTGRIEPEPKWLSSGFKGSYMERRGVAGDRDVVQWIANGWSAGYYYSVNWTGTELDFKTDREKLDELHNLLAIAAE